MNTQQINATKAIGIDIGGTGTKFGIVDKHGNLLGNGEMSTKDHRTLDGYMEELYHNVMILVEKEGGIGNMRGIGVGAPNANYYTGTIEYAPNLPWKGVIPLKDVFERKFGIPCTITNDANAAAIGEMMYGAAKGMKDFIMITLGTGVGSGIVANGKLIYGADGFAGELGHTTVIPDGRHHPGTGKFGSLESYASATGVRLTALEMLYQYSEVESELRSIDADELSSKHVADAAQRGDEIGKKVFEFTGKILGMALANAIMFSRPEAIILFGGLARAGDLLMEPTKRHMEANLIKVFENKVKLVHSQLKESDVAILGASALAWEA